MFQQVFQPAFLPQASMVVNRWSLLDGGKNLDLEIHGCGCGCGGCACGCGCSCGGCGCGCSCSSCSGSDGSESNTDTSTFGECAAAVATEAAIDAVVTGTGTAGFAALTPAGPASIATVAGGAAAIAAANAAIDEARDNEACNTDNWSKWYEAPYNGGDSP